MDIHVIAVNHLANPIRDWVVKIVGMHEPLAMIHRRVDDDQYQTTREFGEQIFSSLNEARDYIDIQLNKQMNNIN